MPHDTTNNLYVFPFKDISLNSTQFERTAWLSTELISHSPICYNRLEKIESRTSFSLRKLTLPVPTLGGLGTEEESVSLWFFMPPGSQILAGSRKHRLTHVKSHPKCVFWKLHEVTVSAHAWLIGMMTLKPLSPFIIKLHLVEEQYSDSITLCVL